MSATLDNGAGLKFLLTLVPTVALKVSIQIATFTTLNYHIKHNEKNLEVNFLTLRHSENHAGSAQSLQTLAPFAHMYILFPYLISCDLKISSSFCRKFLLLQIKVFKFIIWNLTNSPIKRPNCKHQTQRYRCYYPKIQI